MWNTESGAHIRTAREIYFWNTPGTRLTIGFPIGSPTQIVSTYQQNNETDCDTQLTDQHAGAHKIFLIID